MYVCGHMQGESNSIKPLELKLLVFWVCVGENVSLFGFGFGVFLVFCYKTHQGPQNCIHKINTERIPQTFSQFQVD